MKSPEIVVIGGGAIGSMITAFIANAGYDVVMVCKHKELADRVAEGKLHIFGAKRNKQMPIPAVTTVSELSGPKDIVLLATKANDILSAVKDLTPFLKDTSVIVSMQNGMCIDELSHIFGVEHVVGCVIGWGVTMHALGEVEVTSKSVFVIGRADQRIDDNLIAVKKVLSAVGPVRITQNIKGCLYTKLIVNSCINSVGAICGLNLGRMLSYKKVRDVFFHVTHEGLRVAEAMGLEIESFNKTLGLYKFFDKSNIFSRFMRHLLICAMGLKYRKIKSSSLQSLERGRPTEIHFLNGYISKNGKKYMVPTPINDKIVDMVEDIEHKIRKPNPANLNDLFLLI